MLEKYLNHLVVFIKRLHDVRFAGQVIFVILVLLMSWSGIKAIQTNYSLQKQIAALKQQNTVQQLQDNNLKLQNEYYNSNQYLELSARQNFGLGLPGETEVTVPESVALAHTAPLPKIASQQTVVSSKQPAYQRNFQGWIGFFLHRQSTN
ncbi:MAG TPA: septum formation initiator family protein [Candidatus Saccharimonadales bacterium]|nr:septum formation initiator family protein [Candidatus Saccharimonadales bacterium]